MSNQEIELSVKGYHYDIPSWLYITICQCPQVDHIKRDGDWYDIWTCDGWHWRIKIKQ